MFKGEKVCSCFGHFKVVVTRELRERASEAIDKAVEEGVCVFLFGGLSDFDDLIYDIVTAKKQKCSQLDLKRVFCFAQDRDLRKPPHWFQKKEYEEMMCPPKEFDWWYTSLYYRNCSMIDESELVLTFAEERKNSGAYKTYKYALKKHKTNINFAI